MKTSLVVIQISAKYVRTRAFFNLNEELSWEKSNIAGSVFDLTTSQQNQPFSTTVNSVYLDWLDGRQIINSFQDSVMYH